MVSSIFVPRRKGRDKTVKGFLLWLRAGRMMKRGKKGSYTAAPPHVYFIAGGLVEKEREGRGERPDLAPPIIYTRPGRYKDEIEIGLPTHASG